jgi:hypothetical protein
MPYVIDARCLKELAGLSKRFERQPALRIAWFLILPLWVGMYYFGVFFAVPFVEPLPFDFFNSWRTHPPAMSGRIIAIIAVLAMVTLSSIVGLKIYRHFQNRHINIDLGVMFFGSVLAVWYTSLQLPYGWR